MRPLAHYFAAMLLLTLYGGQVCPLLETLTLAHWGTLLALAFATMFLLRSTLLTRLVDRVPFYDQPGRQFLLELALFAAFGLGLALFNSFVLGFTVLESGFKVVIGFLTFGFFISLDLALKREYANGKTILSQGITPPETSRYTSLTRKLSTFTLATVALAGTVLILALVKDVYWLSEVDFAAEGAMAQLLVVLEIVFIFAVLSGYILCIIVSYVRNIRLFFSNETDILRRVQMGDLSTRVPSLTRDEFGEIARYTNSMIEGLVERDRVKKVLGKTVSPAIAERLMERQEHGFSLGGSIHSLTILFCDIRDFTARTEANPPEVVLDELNQWFTQAVEAVTAHDGVVDKFIGDAILAIFGLDGDPDAACEKGLACAEDMRDRLNRLNESLSAPLEAGIALHRGDVIAGLVGSPVRLEFTVIGDVVNTTARIEKLTRELRCPILVSGPLRDCIRDSRAWRDFGFRSFRGKTEKIQLFGLE